MINTRTSRRRASATAWRDIILVCATSVAAAVACVSFDIGELLLGWTRQHERLQLDELPAILLVIACCLIWFSRRRFVEAQDQLLRRHESEAKLADALAENQRLAQQYVDLQEHERKALARDLHDELGQYLHVIKLDAVALRDARQDIDAQVADAARAMIDNIDRVYSVVGTLIRRLRPAGFDELGLAAALEHCVHDWRSRLPGTDIRIAIDQSLDSVDEIRAMALFRLVQEALTNVARHAKASQVIICIGGRALDDPGGPQPPGGTIELRIADNGQGCDLAVRRSGLGLVGMRERVSVFGGSLTLTSSPGSGFQVLAKLPLAAPSPGVISR